MTIKELAEALNVSRGLIEKRTRELFPDKMKNGYRTHFTVQEVTAIGLRIKENSSLATSDDRKRVIDMPKTQLEKNLLIQQAFTFLKEEETLLRVELTEAKEQLQIQAPKVELAETCLRTDKEMSIRNAGKHLNIPQKAFFKMMRDNGYLTKKNIPTQKAINRKVLTLKTGSDDKNNWAQAVMSMDNIMNFQGRHLKAIPVQGNLLEVING